MYSHASNVYQKNMEDYKNFYSTINYMEVNTMAEHYAEIDFDSKISDMIGGDDGDFEVDAE